MFTPKIPMLKNGSKYLQPSPTRKIYWKGFYLSNPLTNGNSKLGKDVLCFDLLAVRTCPNCKDCQKKCYARRGEAYRPTVHDKHALNTMLAVHDMDFLFALITEQLHRTKKKIVRIHSSGDFFSQKYLEMWCHIAQLFPEIKFYGYTKTREIFDFWWADELPNLNIVDSLLPDGSVNFGSLDYIKEKQEKFYLCICPVTCGIEDAECMRTCTNCLTERWMLFKEH